MVWLLGVRRLICVGGLCVCLYVNYLFGFCYVVMVFVLCLFANDVRLFVSVFGLFSGVIWLVLFVCFLVLLFVIWLFGFANLVIWLSVCCAYAYLVYCCVGFLVCCAVWCIVYIVPLFCLLLLVIWYLVWVNLWLLYY